jgi:hypothetical protein
MRPRSLGMFLEALFPSPRLALLIYYIRRYHMLIGGLVVSSWRAKSATIFGRRAYETAHTPHPGLSGQFVQQRFGVFEIGSIEAFSEPAVDFGKHRVRFVATLLLGEQLR